MNKGNGKLQELQVFSGIAILCVVLVHNNAIYLLSILNLQEYSKADFSVRLLDDLINAAVPMFVFISGYKYALNNEKQVYTQYALKRLKKVLKPFLIISIIFIIKNNIGNGEGFINIRNMQLGFMKIFLGFNYAYQLWYVPMYIFISLTYPIIYKLFSNDKIRMLIIVLIIFVQEMLGRRFGILLNKPFNFVYYYLIFEMGLLFKKYDLKSRLRKWDAQIICTYLAAVILLALNPCFDTYFIRYYLMWPSCVIAYYLISLRLINNKLLNYLGKYSFYIFLFHAPIICGRISDIFIDLKIYNSVLYVFVITILTIVSSMIIYKIVKNTFLRNILFTVSKKKNYDYKGNDIVYNEAS